MKQLSSLSTRGSRALRATVWLLGVFAAVVALESVFAQAKKPQYGGQLSIGHTVLGVPTLSWDSADFNWKHNTDTGLVYEQLFTGDLSKSKRNGGKFSFIPDGWIPTDAISGELAESWAWKDNPMRVEVKLRKGVMFPEKPGVMKARELTAEDVVFSYNRLDKSPKKIPGYFDYLAKVDAPDKYTVVFTFKEYSAEWDYRFGWGYYSGILPKEVADAGAGNWKNINGTGPFMLTDYVASNSYTYSKNPSYWGSETLDGQAYKLPFVDKIVYRAIRDEATWLTALRTGKLDILEAVRWSAVPELKKSAPQLKWSKWLATATTSLAMRMDQKPFDDLRVRRALNIAVNKDEILKSYFGGQGMMLAFPMHPDYGGYYEPLETMPASVKELFKFDQAKAKKLLAEAGYPKGFTFKVQMLANSPEADLLQMVAAYLEQVGVKMEIQQLEYGAYFSAMVTHTNTAGYFTTQSPTSPTTTLRKQFVKGQQWNVSQYDDPALDKKIAAIFLDKNEGNRMRGLRELTREVLDKAPYIWLPTQYAYTAWWPWVQNYGGELRAGPARPGPIHARVWVDQEMKKKMGF